VATPTQTRRLTADEFWELYGDKEEFADGLRLHYELLDGQLRDKPMPIDVHGEIQSRILYFLQGYVFAHPIGKSYGEVHFRISARNFFVPDAAFVRLEQLSKITEPGFLPFAPDLAVEIVSPSNTLSEMSRKIKAYIDAGSVQVWIVDPTVQQIVVWYADQTARTFVVGETLTGGDLLPGLSFPVADLFPKDQSNA
jgi:Uma2 family endonuclease